MDIPIPSKRELSIARDSNPGHVKPQELSTEQTHRAAREPAGDPSE